MKRKLKTAATTMAISLAEAKAQCVVEHSDDDALLEALIKSAQDYAEQYVGFAITQTTHTYAFDCFPVALPIQSPNITSVVVTYDDEDNVEQILSTSKYWLDDIVYPASITARDTWPSTYDKPNAVRVDITSGESNAADVPAAIKQAMLLLIAHGYANREAEVVGVSNNLKLGVEQFLDAYRVPICV